MVESPQAKGGKTRAERLSSKQRSEIAAAGARARWAPDEDLPKATHSGVLEIGDAQIPCYVLESGERILSTRGIMKSIGRTWRGRKYAGTQYPVFLEANNLKPFISNDSDPALSARRLRTDKGAASEGYPAEVLPIVCETYLQARDEDALSQSQQSIAKKCEILVRGFSRIGVIALVDEATGYQSTRARQALEEILNKFLSEELRKWAKTFPDEFYAEMFRLKGWSYIPLSVKNPGVVGKCTNDLVYDRLAPGVLDELRIRNPKVDGRRKHAHHQWLTEDVGHPRLREHLSAVIALMKASDSWVQFYRLIQRSLPRYNTNLELALDDPTTEQVR